ncbi:MAG: arylsulfatase [Cytophagales bacterium]|nr:MAG: arylsulfatase [Cytophagales bacterium]
MKSFALPFGLLVVLSISLFSLRPASTWTAPQSPPNIVLLFMDDMGYGDLSCFGATGYQTPNIDRLAAEGMRFTNFLSAQPVCTASRTGLMTGCYPNRIGMYGALFPRSQTGLNHDETTMAELLKSRGYATGIFGKWHLGDNPHFMPRKHGFDEYVGIPYSNDMWPTGYDGKPNTDPNSPKNRFSALPLYVNEDTLKLVQTLDDQSEITGLLTRKAVDFIQRNKRKPFFMYLPNPMPHVPIAASAAFRGKTKHGLYGDVITEIDWSVGEIMRALKANGLDKNTLVIVTSDNGPWYNFGNHAGSTAGLREGKGTTYEGGNRVPCVMRWTGTMPAGAVCNELSSTIDIYPTVAKLTGATLPDRRIDGHDLSGLLLGKTAQSPRTNFYYYYGKNNLEAVRRGEWKLVLPHPGRTYHAHPAGMDGFPGKNVENHPHPLALFNLQRDPGERYDVQAQFPDIVTELQALANTAREDLGDDLTKSPGLNRRPVGTVPGTASAK